MAIGGQLLNQNSGINILAGRRQSAGGLGVNKFTPAPWRASMNDDIGGVGESGSAVFLTEPRANASRMNVRH